MAEAIWTLSQWLHNPGANEYAPIRQYAPAVGIHDVRAIEHIRTYLWDLSDYYVTSVQAGVIWLMPRTQKHRFIVRTYDVVTPESAEQGDYEENGWADFSGNRFPIQDADGRHEENIHTDPSDIGHDCEPEDGDETSAADNAVAFLQDTCYVSEPSSSSFHEGVWYSAEPDQEDDGEVTYSYHLKGFTAEEEEYIYTSLFPRRHGRHQEDVWPN